MTPRLVLGMILKCPWITFGVKNACGMTFPEHFLRVAGFGQITHPNSVISTSSMMLGYGQASNFGSNLPTEKVFPNFWESALNIPRIYIVYESYFFCLSVTSKGQTDVSLIS